MDKIIYTYGKIDNYSAVDRGSGSGYGWNDGRGSGSGYGKRDADGNCYGDGRGDNYGNGEGCGCVNEWNDNTQYE